MPRPIQMPELLDRAITERLKYVYTSLVARVVSYDSSTQLATVQPVLAVDDGTGEPETYPQIQDVRVSWPQGGGYYFHAPLSAGDFVLCLCPHQNHGDWATGGTEGQIPTDKERHGLSVLLAIPCGKPDGEEFSPDGDYLSFGTGDFSVRVTDGAMEVGGNSDAAALNSVVTAFFDAYVNAAPVSNDGGAAIQTAVKAVYTAGSGAASTKLKTGG